MADELNDPVPPDAWPKFEPVATPVPPPMPAAWQAVVLLHPFSPPLSTDPHPDNPFFQLCVASITCMQGQFLSAQIAGCSYGTWWYMVTPTGTQVSTDKGNTWKNVDVGWTLPTNSNNWFGNQASNSVCAGKSPMNWMQARSGQAVHWWKVPVPLENSPPAATWMWFDAKAQVPVRMMFGYGPPSPTKGDPSHLPVLQMYSFIYFPVFIPLTSVSPPTTWADPSFYGFAAGNPKGYKSFVWNSNFGMTAFMTPVNENFNPLPTRVLYIWKPDGQYSVATDRAQNTLMNYIYNTGPIKAQEALLFGKAPGGITPPPHSDAGFLATFNRDGTSNCKSGNQFPFAQEPPNWVSIPAVQGTIQATITDNQVICPATATIISVLFPPAPPNYPEATYLWTWYAPVPGSDGTKSRPITFMQSQSGVNVGTSLALADYYYYAEFPPWLGPSNFSLPRPCGGQA